MTTTRPTSVRGLRWWRSIAGPMITLGIMAAVMGAILLWHVLMGAGGPVRNWLDLRWQPGAWALTADDFPRGSATTLDVQEAWLSDPHPRYDDRHPAVWRLPALEHLHWEDYYVPAPGLMRSGVRVGDLDVFTSVFELGNGVDEAQITYDLAERLRDHEYDVLDETGVRPRAPGSSVDEPLFTDPALRDAVHLGDGTVTTRRLGTYSIELDDGPHGYFGVAGTTTDPDTGRTRQVAAVLALRDEHFVAIGLSAPPAADVDWEAELDRLVGMVDAKMTADPDGNGLTWF